MRKIILQTAVLFAGLATVWPQQVPDFKLLDVGTESPRRGALVSPRDYLMQVSAYYFGGAT